MLSGNLTLILTILGSTVSLLASMYDKVAKKKNLRLILIAMFIVFFIATTKLVIDELQKNQKKQLQEQIETRREMVALEIRNSVREGLEIGKDTFDLLQDLESKLLGKSVDEIGVKLTGLGTEEMRIFEKGNVDEFRPFVMNIEELLKDDTGALPAISLTLNAERKYFPGLIMAYTLANTENMDRIYPSIAQGPNAWDEFPSNEFIRDYGPVEPLVKYVIFYDGDNEHLLGFADASVFIKEMLLYRQMEMYPRIMEILNTPGMADRDSLKRYFKSFKPDVISSPDAYSAAKNMINTKTNEAIVEYGSQYWLVRLASIVKLVS